MEDEASESIVEAGSGSEAESEEGEVTAASFGAGCGERSFLSARRLEPAMVGWEVIGKLVAVFLDRSN